MIFVMSDNPYIDAKIKSFNALKKIWDKTLNEIVSRVDDWRMNIPLIGVRSVPDEHWKIIYVNVDNCYNVPWLSNWFRRDIEVIIIWEDTWDNKELEAFFRNL